MVQFGSSTAKRLGLGTEHYLRDTIAVMEWSVGRGKLLMYGPEVMFRSQPHGTYKLVFNGIHYGAAEAVTLPMPE